MMALSWPRLRSLARDIASWLLVVACVTLVGTFAWMSRRPEDAFFARAAAWPLVGPGVSWARARFLPRAGASARSSAADPDTGAQPEPAAVEVDGEWIGIGAHLRREPRSDAAELGTTGSLEHHMVLERRGRWVRIRAAARAKVTAGGRTVAGEKEGWVDLQAPRDMTPPLGEEALPPGPLYPRAASAEQLERAREAFGANMIVGRLGAYSLLTDLRERSLLMELEQTIAGLEERYASRLGLVPLGSPRETILLYRRRDDYERLRDADERLRGTISSGHAGTGAIALFVEGRPLLEVETTLVHELTHLLNRRAMGPSLPPWLEEGLADELSLLAAGDWQRFRAQSQQGDTTFVTLRGALAALDRVAKESDRETLRSIRELLDLPTEDFLSADLGSTLYAHSSLWVHFLLDSDHESAEGFRAFLRSVRSGGSASTAALERALPGDLSRLDLRFRAWIQKRATAEGVGPQARGAPATNNDSLNP